MDESDIFWIVVWASCGSCNKNLATLTRGAALQNVIFLLAYRAFLLQKPTRTLSLFPTEPLLVYCFSLAFNVEEDFILEVLKD